MRKSGFFWGLVLILAGVAMILRQQGLIDISWPLIWPGGIALLGVFFHLQYFVDDRKSPGLLVPGGILLVVGGLFIFVSLHSEGWRLMSKLWPVFILAPALGIAELTLATRGREGSWTAAAILAIIGGGMLAQNLLQLSMGVVMAVLLIVLGIIIIVRAFRRRKPDPASPQH